MANDEQLFTKVVGVCQKNKKEQGDTDKKIPLGYRRKPMSLTKFKSSIAML